MGVRSISMQFMLAAITVLISCTPSGGEKTAPPGIKVPNPKGYVCYRTSGEVVPDGRIVEADWEKVPWTDYFVDIEGEVKPKPRFNTRVKMLWDDRNLYIAAQLEEPHLWATLRQRDTVIFYDHDFEVFIDPDGDTHAYYELEVNALGTAWDLMLIKPYRDGGPPVNGWDIRGLVVGVDLDGTLNEPSDTDRGWTVEMLLPIEILKECAPEGKAPQPGDQWRINFSRVEWRTVVDKGSYRKEINPETGKPYPEDNWVWSPQEAINMHMPEMWGYLQFSALPAGQGTESFVPDVDLQKKWMLRQVYHAQVEFYEKNGRYAEQTAHLHGLKAYSAEYELLEIRVTNHFFEASLPSSREGKTWVIKADGQLLLL